MVTHRLEIQCIELFSISLVRVYVTRERHKELLKPAYQTIQSLYAYQHRLVIEVLLVHIIPVSQEAPEHITEVSPRIKYRSKHCIGSPFQVRRADPAP